MIEAKDFPQSNREIAKSQKQYNTLHVHVSQDETAVMTSSWVLSFRDKVKLIFGARIWLQVMTFSSPLQPLKMSVVMPEHLIGQETDESTIG